MSGIANTLKIAIASDLHAFSDAAVTPRPSHLYTGDPEDNWRRHPISGLFKLIDQHASTSTKLSADLLLCPGDLGDKADPLGIKYAWSAMEKLRAKLNADILIGTTGNHDVDSRFKHHGFDPLDTLKTLDPPYPLPDDTRNNHYWSKHYSVIEDTRYRLVVLNSSAFHVGSAMETANGRISTTTLSQIASFLEQRPPAPANILLCHHHPQQHSELDLGDYDWMKEGQQLLDLLGTGQFGHWLIIHGHKHHPKLSYASGSSASPIVLSAGSLSAALYPLLAIQVKNQFYLLSIDLEMCSAYGLAGSGLSWFWSGSDGWLPSGTGAGLPAVFGFGYRGDLVHLALRVSQQVTQRIAEWESLTQKIQELNFLIPSDLKALSFILQRSHKKRIEFDDRDCPVRIGVVI
jgi:hypothetical protein